MLKYFLPFLLIGSFAFAAERRSEVSHEAERKVERRETDIAAHRESWRGNDITNRPRGEFHDVSRLEAGRAETKQIEANREAMPPDAQKALREVESGANRPNVRNPEHFTNDGRDGTQRLPPADGSGKAITYTEHTVNPRPPGGALDGKRIVTGSDNSGYYTGNHYQTFQRVK